MTRLPVSTTASQRAVEPVHQYGLAHGLGIPDSLIAAIAMEGAHTLVTDNVRHFRFIPAILSHIEAQGTVNFTSGSLYNPCALGPRRCTNPLVPPVLRNYYISMP